MLRGIEDEPRAVDEVQPSTTPPSPPTGFMVANDWGFHIGYSPDGLVGDDGLIEVKSRRQKKQLQTILADEVPAENMAQLQCGLLVSGPRLGRLRVLLRRDAHVRQARRPRACVGSTAIVAAVGAVREDRRRMVPTTQRTKAMPTTERVTVDPEMVVLSSTSPRASPPRSDQLTPRICAGRARSPSPVRGPLRRAARRRGPARRIPDGRPSKPSAMRRVLVHRPGGQDATTTPEANDPLPRPHRQVRAARTRRHPHHLLPHRKPITVALTVTRGNCAVPGGALSVADADAPAVASRSGTDLTPRLRRLSPALHLRRTPCRCRHAGDVGNSLTLGDLIVKRGRAVKAAALPTEDPWAIPVAEVKA